MAETFIQFLQSHSKEIIAEWIEGTIATYPGETARMLKGRDEFANPVGVTLSQCLADLFNTLLNSPDPNTLEKAVDPIIRIRAIQTFNASEAIRFIFFIKKILRELLQKEGNNQFQSSLADFELFVDQTALSAFNVYTNCKQTVYELKAERAGKQVSTLLKKTGYLTNMPDTELADVPETKSSCESTRCGNCGHTEDNQ